MTDLDAITSQAESLRVAREALERLGSSDAMTTPFFDGKSEAWKELQARRKFAEKALAAIDALEKKDHPSRSYEIGSGEPID